MVERGKKGYSNESCHIHFTLNIVNAAAEDLIEPFDPEDC